MLSSWQTRVAMVPPHFCSCFWAIRFVASSNTASCQLIPWSYEGITTDGYPTRISYWCLQREGTRWYKLTSGTHGTSYFLYPKVCMNMRVICDWKFRPQRTCDATYSVISVAIGKSQPVTDSFLMGDPTVNDCSLLMWKHHVFSIVLICFHYWVV